MDYARKIKIFHNGPQHHTKLKWIERFGDANQVNSSNFNAMTQFFREIRPSIFSFYLISQSEMYVWRSTGYSQDIIVYIWLSLECH